MFERLPTITEASYRTFIDKELLEVLNNVNPLMELLRQKNSYLARAIVASSESVSEDFEGETKEMVVSEAVACQLLVLRLIDRALEAQQLEAELLQKASTKRKQ